MKIQNATKQIPKKEKPKKEKSEHIVETTTSLPVRLGKALPLITSIENCVNTLPKVIKDIIFNGDITYIKITACDIEIRFTEDKNYLLKTKTFCIGGEVGKIITIEENKRELFKSEFISNLVYLNMN